jgi:hypothetical protein
VDDPGALRDALLAAEQAGDAGTASLLRDRLRACEDAEDAAEADAAMAEPGPSVPWADLKRESGLDD